MIKSGYEQKSARVEMLPLIDVIFLLLVFFLYAMLSMAVQHGLAIDLPSVSKAEIKHEEAIHITITKENKFFLEGKDGTPLELDEFEIVSKIDSYARSGVKTPIFIHGDSEANLGKSLALLSALQASGYLHVAFAVKEEKR